MWKSKTDLLNLKETDSFIVVKTDDGYISDVAFNLLDSFKDTWKWCSVDELIKLNCDILDIVKLFLRLNPKHTEWVKVNYPELFKEIEELNNG